MSWGTPKTDWNSTQQENVGGDDFNRIEGNTQFLYDQFFNNYQLINMAAYINGVNKTTGTPEQGFSQISGRRVTIVQPGPIDFTASFGDLEIYLGTGLSAATQPFPSTDVFLKIHIYQTGIPSTLDIYAIASIEVIAIDIDQTWEGKIVINSFQESISPLTIGSSATTGQIEGFSINYFSSSIS